MKNIFFLFSGTSSLLFVSILCGCHNSQDSTALLQQVDDGLLQSNQQIRLGSSEILEAIKLKTYEPATAERAKKIYPEASSLQNETDSIFKYIESFRSLLNQNGSSHLGSKNIKELHGKLADYKRKVLSLDDRLSEDLSGKIFVVSEKIDSSNQVLTALEDYLLNKQPSDAKAYLRLIENSLAMDEQKVMKFLHYRTTPIIDNYTVFEAIVGQNTRVLTAGETLEIMAGLGKFSTRKLPVISVRGSIVPINEKGLAVCKIRTSSRPGHYSIPVQIKFTDEDGKEQIRIIAVEYKTVSADLK